MEEAALVREEPEEEQKENPKRRRRARKVKKVKQKKQAVLLEIVEELPNEVSEAKVSEESDEYESDESESEYGIESVYEDHYEHMRNHSHAQLIIQEKADDELMRKQIPLFEAARERKSRVERNTNSNKPVRHERKNVQLTGEKLIKPESDHSDTDFEERDETIGFDGYPLSGLILPKENAESTKTGAYD